MELPVVDLNSQNPAKITQVNDTVFGVPFNEALVHQVVTQYLTNRRAGTKAQKSRAMVSGGGIKPWRQKGTGRARAGSIRSPLWRKGGVTFAAQPKSYHTKINTKMYRGVLRSIFSELVRQNRIVVVENMNLPDHKTKTLLQRLKSLGLERAFIVVESIEKNLEWSSRNLSHVEINRVRALDLAKLIHFEKILLTEPVLHYLNKVLA
ncbi:MAG: 50S ribosomal protein L4 [Gammaproteobacteria bacterium]|nr:50S ribosomal protein L4 [Gammaproteobacteria bacterium]